MKSFLSILIGLATICQVTAQRLVINGAYVKIDNLANVIQMDSTHAAISAVDGGIQTAKGSSLVWNVSSTDTNRYTVPFVDMHGTPIPVTYRNEYAGNTGKLGFMTWSMDESDSTSFGQEVTLKRLWRINGLARPALVELKYADRDIPQALLAESLLSITRFWNGQWINADETTVDPARNTIRYAANDAASYSTTWGVIELDIPLATNIRWLDYECNLNRLVWESDLSGYKYVIYGSLDGFEFVPIDSSQSQGRINSASVNPKYKYLKLQQKFDNQKKYESRMIKTCSIRIPVDLGVHPNPTTGRIWVENAVEPSIEVRDLNGRYVLGAESDQVDIGGLTNGVYLVKVLDGDASKNFRIVKI